MINVRNVNFLILPTSENSASLSFPPGKFYIPSPPPGVPSGHGAGLLHTQGTCPGCAVLPTKQWVKPGVVFTFI